MAKDMAAERRLSDYSLTGDRAHDAVESGSRRRNGTTARCRARR